MSAILLVGRGYPEVGGIPSFLAALEMGLSSSREHDVRFLNLATRRGDAGRLTAGNLSRTFGDALAVWRNARDRQVVHINSALSPGTTLARAGLLAFAARARGCKVIVHAHGGRFPLWMTSRARRLAARAAIAPAHRLVAVSAGTRDALAKAGGGDRVTVIPNGVDVAAFGPPEGPHDPPRVFFAGYLTRRKGVGDLLQASASLRARGVDHELVLAGGNAPDDDPEMMETLAERAGHGIRLLGPQPFESMPDLYRSADVYCLPSWWEAMPISVLEAMASGLPVVATRVGDIPSIVEDGVSGRLVPARDPAALSAALEEILGDPARRRAMGAAARARVEERYAAAATTAAISDLYKQLSP